MVLTTALQQYLIANNPDHNIKNENCDKEIFANGKPIIILDGKQKEIELLVSTVAAITGIPVDWHYSGGRAQVLYIGGEIEHHLLTRYFERNRLIQMEISVKNSGTISDLMFNWCFDGSCIHKFEIVSTQYTNYQLSWKVYADELQYESIKLILRPLQDQNLVLIEARSVWLPCENVYLLKKIAFGEGGLYRAPAA